MEKSGYEFRIRGRVNEPFLGAFDDLTVSVKTAETVLRGYGLDQAGLYGVLARIQALGFELIEVRRIGPAPRPGVDEQSHKEDGDEGVEGTA